MLTPQKLFPNSWIFLLAFAEKIFHYPLDLAWEWKATYFVVVDPPNVQICPVQKVRLHQSLYVVVHDFLQSHVYCPSIPCAVVPCLFLKKKGQVCRFTVLIMLALTDICWDGRGRFHIRENPAQIERQVVVPPELLCNFALIFTIMPFF